MISKVRIVNYKIFRGFELDCNDDLNILVGNNETGKSTILEAINIALTRRLNGRALDQELSPYLFTRSAVSEYLAALHRGNNPDLPKITIELCFHPRPEFERLRGSNNLSGSDAIGVKIEVAFDEDFRDEYKKLITNPSAVRTIPTEYYKIGWYSFANDAITARGLGVGVSYIDATTIRLQSGTDYYVQNIIHGGLEAKERIGLALAYRRLKEHFSDEPAIKDINQKLAAVRGSITDKDFAVGIDMSQRSHWEMGLTPHLDDIPFQFVGKGEQNKLKIMLALNRKAEEAQVVLLEEPENHLSFAEMTALLGKIRDKCQGKQIFLTTHSAYVLNKLGLDKLVFLYGREASFMKGLPVETQNYFKKLSGYDTLRLILARRCILVEGPSDELIVQKAYLLKHGRLPLEDGIDVINVRGLSFARFLDIAIALGVHVAVVTDNDGDYEKKVVRKYQTYSEHPNISICADPDESLPTLEPQIAACNDLTTMNAVLGLECATKRELTEYMLNNKTECAVKLFET